MDHHAFATNEQLVAPQPKKSPPLAFQMTSNDALYAPTQLTLPSQLNFTPDYLNSPSARYKPDYDVSSPMEQDLESQVRRQQEALRLQHQAFVVERECWEMEKERLYKRIASLESLLKSPKDHSPARSPVITPFVNGNSSSASTHRTSPAASQHRNPTTGAASRLPSIAEDDASPAKSERRASFFQRANAPHHIDLADSAVFSSGEEDVEEGALLDGEDPASPIPTRQALSPPPPAYRKDAGHTPLRLPSRPTSSQSHSPTRRALFQEGLEETPTRRNTARNLSIAKKVDEDPELSGPLHLPELPHQPSDVNFTLEALSARLHWIEEHPDDNQPLALTARSNQDEQSEIDASEVTVKAEPAHFDGPKDTPSLSRGETSAAEVSPPPASEASVAASQASQTFSPHDFPDHGVRLKKKTSTNFGAPFGQLRP